MFYRALTRICSRNQFVAGDPWRVAEADAIAAPRYVMDTLDATGTRRV